MLYYCEANMKRHVKQVHLKEWPEMETPDSKESFPKTKKRLHNPKTRVRAANLPQLEPYEEMKRKIISKSRLSQP